MPQPSPASTTLYVDGACRGNPGKGGWGVYIEFLDGRMAEYCGGEAHTTNNRMELMAAIQGLKHTDPAQPIVVWTDSSYVQKGISEWIHGWKKKNWRKSDGSAVMNADLWQMLDQLQQARKIDWRWIKGHAGHAGNEKADQLANQGLEKHDRGAGNSSMAAEMAQPKALVRQDTRLVAAPSTSIMDLMLPPDDSAPEEPDWLEEAYADDSGHAAAGAYEDEADLSADTVPESPIPSAKVSENLAAASDETATSTNSGIIRTQNKAPLDAFSQSGHRQLILDTETTGFDPKTGDRIVEIGVVELINRKLTGNSLHVYLNPDRPVGDSQEIHGLSDDFLKDQVRFKDIVNELEAFLIGADLIAHNASFDMRFLEAEFAMAGRAPLAPRVTVIDTLAMAKRKHPGQKNSLDALVRRYEIPERDRTFHGALLDAEILVDVYLHMTGGQVTLDMEQAEDASGSIAQSQTRIRRKLTVIKAHAEELVLHDAWMAKLDGGKDGPISVWSKLAVDPDTN